MRRDVCLEGLAYCRDRKLSICKPFAAVIFCLNIQIFVWLCLHFRDAHEMQVLIVYTVEHALHHSKGIPKNPN